MGKVQSENSLQCFARSKQIHDAAEVCPITFEPQKMRRPCTEMSVIPTIVESSIRDQLVKLLSV